jgi:uncharacterized protein with NRDE domain
MCTLISFYRTFEAYPVVVGMNRDEVVNRRCTGPQLIRKGLKIYAPIDLHAGGTWLGINECGVLAAVLNRVSEKPNDAPACPRSRGLLCLDALARHSAAEIREFVMEETQEPRYNKFDLLCMDSKNAFLIHYDNVETIRTEELQAGLHVLVNYESTEPTTSETNRKARERSMLRKEKALELLEELQPGKVEEAIDRLIQVFRNHENGVCQHRTRHDLSERASDEFATRSSTIIAAKGAPAIFLHTNGSPCTSEYEDYFTL